MVHVAAALIVSTAAVVYISTAVHDRDGPALRSLAPTLHYVLLDGTIDRLLVLSCLVLWSVTAMRSGSYYPPPPPPKLFALVQLFFFFVSLDCCMYLALVFIE